MSAVASTDLSSSVVNELNELHEYINETIDGVNRMNDEVDTRLSRLETEFRAMKAEFGEIMYQLQLQLREVVEYEQTSQKEARARIKKIGNYMLTISKQYRHQSKTDASTQPSSIEK